MRLLRGRLSQKNVTYGRWREHLTTLIEFNRSVMLIADPDALMASISARIEQLFGADRIIFLRSIGESNAYTISFSLGYEAEELKKVTLTQRDRLAKWLLTNETALMVREDSEVCAYLSAGERAMLEEMDVRVCVPLLALSRLTGMILLSSTDKEWALSSDDLSVVMMVAIQAGIAIENACLLEEQRERLRKLYRAERLATAGQLAASIAHEIRNPLTAIRSTVQYLLKQHENKPERALIEGVISEVDRMNRTVDGLLSLTRRTEFKADRIDVGQLIRQTLLLLQNQARDQSVSVEWPEPTPDLFVMGDVSQLKQLFLNLMLNGLQAMTGGGELQVKLAPLDKAIGPDSYKAWVRVSIIDTGCGIPPEHMENIFDPFFTTKSGGTGLGLSTSHAIVRQHAGELEITSVQGSGTRVTIQLPLIG